MAENAVTRDTLRLVGIAAASALALVVLGIAAWDFDPFHRRAKAEAKATTATTQAAVSEASTQALDRVIRVETTIRSEAAGAVQNVQAAQGATDELDPALAAAVRAGVGRLRDHGASGADQPAGSPESPL
jgi:hypothetical protein